MKMQLVNVGDSRMNRRTFLLAALLAIPLIAEARGGGRRGGSSSRSYRAYSGGGKGSGGSGRSGGCGSRGGPGYRKSNGKCASWK